MMKALHANIKIVTGANMDNHKEKDKYKWGTLIKEKGFWEGDVTMVWWKVSLLIAAAYGIGYALGISGLINNV